MTDGVPPESAWIADYADLQLDEVLALAQLQGRVVRTVGPGDVVTLDWRPDRLTVRLDRDGALVDVRAG